MVSEGNLDVEGDDYDNKDGDDHEDDDGNTDDGCGGELLFHWADGNITVQTTRTDTWTQH